MKPININEKLTTCIMPVAFYETDIKLQPDLIYVQTPVPIYS